MKCAVFNCGKCNERKASEWSFFRFPTDKLLLGKWIKFCQRAKSFNPRTAAICMSHFVTDDFANNLQFDMGFAKKRLLKRGAIPTILNPNKDKPPINLKRKVRPNKEIAAPLLKECSPHIIEYKTSEPTDIEREQIVFEELYLDTEPNIQNASVLKEKEEYILNTNQKDENYFEWEIEQLKRKLQNLRHDNWRLNAAQRKFVLRLKAAEKKYIKRLENKKRKHSQVEARLTSEIHNLNVRLKKAAYEVLNMEDKMAAIFTKGQIKKLKRGDKRKTWSKDDIIQSMTLYDASTKAYKLLQQKGFPLPAIRTLQKWKQNRIIETVSCNLL